MARILATSGPYDRVRTRSIPVGIAATNLLRERGEGPKVARQPRDNFIASKVNLARYLAPQGDEPKRCGQSAQAPFDNGRFEPPTCYE